MQLTKVKVTRPKKRVGRGVGSGKGWHTAGRGQKGQKSRNHVDIMFEGLKMRKSLLNRLPLMRGKGKNGAGEKPVEITLTQLDTFPSGAKVTVAALIENKIVKQDEAFSRGVKVLSTGELSKKLTVLIPSSKGAAEKIQAVGGTIE
jgi:large subunit ribosomal protein L15